LSGNSNLSGHLPSFSNAASLETLRIDWTNFTYVTKPSYFSDFKAVTELGIDGKIISMEFHPLFGMLASLHELFMTQVDSPRQLETLFSWLEGIKNLRSLSFIDCDLSMIIPSSIGNLRNLTSLLILGSNFTTQTLSSVTNIRNLKNFEIYCDDSDYMFLAGKLPSAIGNMSNLEKLDISGCQLSGPIPHEVGALKELKSLVLHFIGLSGRIASTIANLTQLTELQLDGNHLRGTVSSLAHKFTPSFCK
jgi:Leucine-rich repeat (LRR) protein